MDKNWQVPEYKIVEFFKKRTTYCIGIPVVNEGDRFKKQLLSMKKYANLADILIFDGESIDGSTDEKFLKEQEVRALLVGPAGQSRQLRFGLAFALKEGYEGIITVDGNGKDDTSTIPHFLQALEEGYDYTQGSRFIKGGYHKNTPLHRLLMARFIISPLLSLKARYWYTDTPNAFRAYSRRYLLHPMVKPFRDIFTRYELLFYLVTRANPLRLKTKEIPVSRTYPRREVPTKIVGWKRIVDLINIFKIALGIFDP